MLGIIGAMDKEVNALLEKMDIARESQVGYTHYYAGTLLGVPVCLARCGIGKVHAALCALGMILEYRPDAILNIGVAGALTDSLRVGDFVIARSAVQHDMDTTPIGDPLGLISGLDLVHIPCDEKLSQLLMKAAQQRGLAAEWAAIATGDQFITGTEKKDFLSVTFGAAACDMEGGAIAQCCYEMNVPCAACRCISDTRLGDGREYEEKAMYACAREGELLQAFIPLYQQENEVQNHG